ncbi:MAG: hypothetical protein BJ554DRAFT_2317, partial [Olpidium bornovanus]
VVADFGRLQLAELRYRVLFEGRRGDHAGSPRVADDADLDRRLRHLPLEALLQRQYRRVHRVFDLHVGAEPESSPGNRREASRALKKKKKKTSAAVTLSRTASRVPPKTIINAPLLQESLRVDHVLPDGRRLPRPVRPGRVDLVQGRAVIVVAGDEKRNSERPDAAARAPGETWKLRERTRERRKGKKKKKKNRARVLGRQTYAPALRVFLHHGGDLLDELADGGGLHVDLLVGLHRLPGLVNEDSGVRAHPGVHQAGVPGHGHDLLERGLVDQRGSRLLLGDDHHPVRRWGVAGGGDAGRRAWR